VTRPAPAAPPPVREPEPAGNAILLAVAISGGMLLLFGCGGLALVGALIGVSL
jgi:hypothetical protein